VKSAADLGTFSQTGAPQKGGCSRPENVGRQGGIFWPVGTYLWHAATFKSSLGAAQHYLASKASEFRKPHLKSGNSRKMCTVFKL